MPGQWLRDSGVAAAVGVALCACADHARLERGEPEAGKVDGPPGGPVGLGPDEAGVNAVDANVEDTGACAASCQGTCADGRCLVVLAMTAWPADIAVDDRSVYFTSCPTSADGTGGTALSVPLSGGLPATIASGTGCAASLALGGANLYLAGLNGNDIASVPSRGGSLTTIVSSPDKPLGIAVGGNEIFWATQGGAMMKMALSGGGPSLLATCQRGCTRPVVQGGDVYWGDSAAGTIETAPGDGSSPVTVTSGVQAVGAMAISGDKIYFASGYQLGQVSIHGGMAANVGLPTGAPVGAVAADDTSVYFTSWGSIWKIGFTEVEPTRIAANQGDPNAIVVDSTSVYWTNADAFPSSGCCGQVMRLTPK